MSFVNSLNNLTSDVQIVSQINENNFSIAGDKLLDLVDEASESYEFMKSVISKPNAIHSVEDLLVLRNELSKFSFSTQIASKMASAVVKDVETLTKIQ